MSRHRQTAPSQEGLPPVPGGRALVLAGSLSLIALIAFLDSTTGTELRTYPLYVLPIAAVSWSLGLRFGILAAALALMAWFASSFIAGVRLPAAIWVLNATAHLAAFTTVVVLVAYLQRSRASENRLARTDSLTGLPNTRAFYESAVAEIERQRRRSHPVTLAFLDLDDFKEINDRFGHETGDRALRAAADAIRATTRVTDVPSRMGGDEFALLLPETDRDGALRILERVRAAIAGAFEDRGWPSSCSIGAVTFDEPPEKVDALVGIADSLMYRVKRSGKNAVRVVRLSPTGLQCISTGGCSPEAPPRDRRARPQ